MAQFFINRPIFAWVLALFIAVIGGVAVKQLPIAQYPPVAPPAIALSVTYPGASAQTLEDAVISIIELASLTVESNPRPRVDSVPNPPGLYVTMLDPLPGAHLPAEEPQ